MKKKKRKLAASFTALLAAVSMLTASMFASPNELLQEAPESEITSSAVLSQASGQPDAIPEQISRMDKLKKRILRLPFGVRLFLGVPLWGIGSGLHALAEYLWRLLSPVWVFLGKCLLTAVLALAVVWVLSRIFFPDKKWKDILSKKKLLAICIGAVVVHSAELWAEKADCPAWLPVLIRYGGLLIMALAVSFPLIIEEKRTRSGGKPKPVTGET